MNHPHPTPDSRRDWLLAGAGVIASAALPLAARAQTAPAQASDLPATATSAAIPMVLPRTEFVYEAIADLAPALDLGQGPVGERRMVPISGGTFEGPGLRGKVLAGGADRQLLRRDGVRQLDALYELQTDDGAILTVHNQVMSRTDAEGRPYRFSHINITAPQGKYGWLNQFVYVGTLHSLQPARLGVVIRVYKLV
jgi:hypothetical protein